MGERAPADALTLAAVAAGAGSVDGRPQVDLSGIWAQSADMAAARSTTLMRTLDGKGRLQLPVDSDAATRLPAERDGALVTVYLPGSTEQPRPNYATNALPLDARGRLTVTAGVRREAGIPDGADVLAVLDPDRRTVTLTAASCVDAGVTGLFDGLRRPAAAAFGETARAEDAVIRQATRTDAGIASDRAVPSRAAASHAPSTCAGMGNVGRPRCSPQTSTARRHFSYVSTLDAARRGPAMYRVNRSFSATRSTRSGM
ncbi:hypothetical protein ACI789_17120 [Geodermatophilus sp. SYSU D00965]